MDGILSEFLKQHRAKVQEATMWDYNEELHNKTLIKEGYEDGYDDGYGNGYGNGSSDTQISIYKKMISSGYSAEEAMSLTGVTKDQLAETVKS